MKTITKILGAFLCACSLGASLAQADETFTQDGQNYVLKSGVVGVIRKPMSTYQMNEKQRAEAQKQKTFFDVYDESTLKARAPKAALKTKFRVVYKQVTNPNTHAVTEVPALLTGNVIVQTNNTAVLKTSLKMKKSFQADGFYLYELPTDRPVAQVLNELSAEPGIKARVEVIEHLRVPL